MCGNPSQSIRGFAGPEDSFHFIPVAAVLILLFLCLPCQILVLRRPPHRRAGKPDLVFPAISQRLPVPIDLVRQDPFRITAISLPVAYYRAIEIFSLAVRLEIQTFDSDPAIRKADVELGAERCVSLFHT